MWRRIKVLCIVAIILTLSLIGRLAYIQLRGCEALSAAAEKQQAVCLEGADDRGDIYDRNGAILAGDKKEFVYIFQKKTINTTSEKLLDKLDAEEVRSRNGQYRVFSSEKYDKETGKQLVKRYGAYIIETGRRYDEKQTAAHMIGYVRESDKRGASGLELMYDKDLSGYNKRLFAFADLNGKFLRDRDIKIKTGKDGDSSVKDGITTTIDAGIQKKVEEILSKDRVRGAAIVLDSKSGDILAAAVNPSFDPKKIQTYLGRDTSELINKITQGEYAPGSVFKIVVLSAALEKGYSLDDTFICNGREYTEGIGVNCSTGGEKGHGKITLKEAFAQSCNCVFIQLGKKIGEAAILKKAKEMGLGNRVLQGYPGEAKGRLMDQMDSAGAGIANLSIGQGENLATPLQIAKMTNIIANKGEDPGVRIIRDESRHKGETGVMDTSCAEKVTEAMKEVMKSGTGTGSCSEIAWAGKTGSAETTYGGKATVNGWMTGFVPSEDPQYTITVLIERDGGGAKAALPVFDQIIGYFNASRSFDKAFFSMRDT